MWKYHFADSNRQVLDLYVWDYYYYRMATEQEVEAYVRQQLAISDVRTKNAIKDRSTGKPFPRRSAILKLQLLVRNFQAGKDPRWIAILGLRGVGKTTMISQLFQSIKCEPLRKNSR